MVFTINGNKIMIIIIVIIITTIIMALHFFSLEIESQSVEPILLFAVEKLVLLVIYPRRLFACFLQPVH